MGETVPTNTQIEATERGHFFIDALQNRWNQALVIAGSGILLLAGCTNNGETTEDTFEAKFAACSTIDGFITPDSAMSTANAENFSTDAVLPKGEAVMEDFTNSQDDGRTYFEDFQTNGPLLQVEQKESDNGEEQLVTCLTDPATLALLMAVIGEPSRDGQATVDPNYDYVQTAIDKLAAYNAEAGGKEAAYADMQHLLAALAQMYSFSEKAISASDVVSLLVPTRNEQNVVNGFDARTDIVAVEDIAGIVIQLPENSDGKGIDGINKVVIDPETGMVYIFTSIKSNETKQAEAEEAARQQEQSGDSSDTGSNSSGGGTGGSGSTGGGTSNGGGGSGSGSGSGGSSGGGGSGSSGGAGGGTGGGSNGCGTGCGTGGSGGSGSGDSGGSGGSGGGGETPTTPTNPEPKPTPKPEPTKPPKTSCDPAIDVC